MPGQSVVVRVEGARELRRTLKQAGDDLDDLKDVHGRVAAIVAAATRVRVPFDDGDLLATIRSSGTKTAAIVRAGTKAVPYAGVQEWGWPRRHIRAQPYVVPAAHDTESTWQGVYLAGVQTIVDKVKGA